ncbi:ESF1 homolog [Denticeps clupeoides]|uniref:ESF1 homolog n=1 Tax=Denticeps clupeoides TaxID=299321 RepID=A0AAY4AK15_9TELE|nr:ESF1 homolog [Denticeps clupeoides]XP_028828015.1 ESF1 homolog [Denticeps clupeoides]XP_028828016.1 ESF1 homolog [Denticeps clupeoides]
MASKKDLRGDDRFQKVQKDPRFWEMPDKDRRIKIDKRFRSMFHDERFKLKYTVDKRGRPVDHTSSDDLKRFYNLADSDPSEAESEGDDSESKNGEDAPETKRTSKATRGVKVYEEEEASNQDDDDDDEEEADDDDDDDEAGSGEESQSEDEESGSDSGPDLARGKGNIETSSDEEDDEGNNMEEILHHEEEEIEHNWGEMWKDAPRSDDVTRRLAVCNMDWDRLKAKDLLALFNSFKPKGGVVFSVKIYPSEFGKERMRAEQTQGPLELRSLPDNPDADNEEQRIYREKVRDYQFKRLRYYYAVVECDSADTAAQIYQECDGFEYESSCSTMDLRFIPEDLMFDEEPKDLAVDVDLAAYKPKIFTSTATTTAKVELTWDETDHDRVTAMSKKFNKDELLDMDFKAYLASSSEEEVEEEQGEEVPSVQEPAEEKEKKKKKKKEDQLAKYRELLQGIQEKEQKQQDRGMEMEVTWVPGLKETTEKLVKKKLEGKDKLTPWEEFLQKKKDKKKQKRKDKQEPAEAVNTDDELPPDVDLSDPFFSEELGSAGLKTKSRGKKKNKVAAEERTPEEVEELERQKAEMALLMDDDEDEKHKHFNYDKIVEHQNLSKKKRKKLLKRNTPLEEDDFQVDVKDPRFEAMFTSHLYNLDPSDPGYKKTRATQSILEEKQRRREQQRRSQEAAALSSGQPRSPQEATGDARTAMDPSLSLLIRNIKNKTEQFQARKKRKAV